MHPRICILLSKMYRHYYGQSVKDVLIYLQLKRGLSDHVEEGLAEFFKSLDREDLIKVIGDILENEDAKADERELWHLVPQVTALTSLIDFEGMRSSLPQQCYWRSQLIDYLGKEGIKYDEALGMLKYKDQEPKRILKPAQIQAETVEQEGVVKSIPNQKVNQVKTRENQVEEYFHVRVTRSRDKEDDALEFNLEKPHMLENIVNKYNEEGITKFKCGGYLIDSSDVEKIEIYLTTETSSAVAASSGVTLTSKESSVENWNAIASKGKEVTGKFIKFATNPWHDKRLICLNGHVINNSSINKREKNRPYCNTCGEQTITSCQVCNDPIKGDQYKPHLEYLGPRLEAPHYCENCGKEFPWTKALIDKSMQDKIFDSNIEPVKWLENLINKFPSIIGSLGQKRDSRQNLMISNEYDLQALLHALLFLRFDDIRPEDPTPIVAGRSAKMDFVLKEEEIVLEVKIAKRGHDEKQIGEELFLDITKYSERPDCKTLIFFIYDKDGVVQNKKGLKNDIEKKSSSRLQILLYFAS